MMAPMSQDIAVPTLIAHSVVVEPDAVRILDRRVFPLRRSWVVCRTHHEVAEAIEAMVTQSLGPLFAATGAMVLAARAADRLPSAERAAYLTAAGDRLIATRRTNNGIRDAVTAVLAAARPALVADEPLTPVVTAAADRVAQTHRAGYRRLGEHGAALLADGDTVLTHCWGESYLTETVAAALRAGKRLRAVCTETRPYLQGARLTAESLAEMGVPTTVITDGMAAHLMSRGEVAVFLSGADRVTLDGHVVNKIGTLQIAVAAHAFGVPYYPLITAPDPLAPDVTAVELEDRDGDEVLHCLGARTASELVTGRYPAFDVTPPRFVSAVVTERGRFSPYDLAGYFASTSASTWAARSASA